MRLKTEDCHGVILDFVSIAGAVTTATANKDAGGRGSSSTVVRTISSAEMGKISGGKNAACVLSSVVKVGHRERATH